MLSFDLAKPYFRYFSEVATGSELADLLESITRELGFRYFALTHHVDIRRNPDAGRRYFQRAEVLNSVRLTDHGITHGEVQEAVAFWSEREAELRNGSAS